MKPFGVWVQRHKRYLHEIKRATYTTLFTSGRLNSYLADIDEQAEDMLCRLVKQIVERKGATEQLKAENQMEWVRQMNNLRACVMEIVNEKLIFT